MTSDNELLAEVESLEARLRQLEARLRGTFKGGRKPGSEVEVLLADIGSLHAAFELEGVDEVVPAAALQPIPEAPPWVLGTLNLRGNTIPVVHIGARLHGGHAELNVEDLILIASAGESTAGFVVSSVQEIAEIRLDDRASLNETPHANYVVGTFTHKGVSRLLLGSSEILRHADVHRHLREGGARS